MEFLDWAELPDNLLGLILHRLTSPSDYVRFSVVCRSWNFVAKDNSREHSAPMLLTYSGEEKIWNLCDMTNQKVLNLQVELPNTRFCGFSKGWLVAMDDNFIVTLINPFSKVVGRRPTRENSTFDLPPLHPPEMSDERYRTKWTRYHEYFVNKAIISADPVSSAKDCTVVVSYADRGRLAFIRLHGDTRWTYIDAGIIERVYEIIYAEDKLYALDSKNRGFSCDITTTSQLNFTLVAETFEEHVPVGSFMLKEYLVESSEGLVMVVRCMRTRQRRHRPRVTVGFIVFKLDAYHRKWAPIDTLGDVALFLGDSVISVMASDFPGCKRNCIYFIHDWELLSFDRFRRPRDFGVCDLTDQKYFPFEDAGTLIKMSSRTPIWTMANIKL